MFGSTLSIHLRVSVKRDYNIQFCSNGVLFERMAFPVSNEPSFKRDPGAQESTSRGRPRRPVRRRNPLPARPPPPFGSPPGSHGRAPQLSCSGPRSVPTPLRLLRAAPLSSLSLSLYLSVSLCLCLSLSLSAFSPSIAVSLSLGARLRIH